MKWLDKILCHECTRLFSWTVAQQDEERLQAEIEEHLALQTAENLVAKRTRGVKPH